MQALRGAAETLRTRRPTLVLSVHDELIQNYGGSVAAVDALLTDAGYGYKELSVDHERHWWCEPNPPGPATPGPATPGPATPGPATP